MKAAERKGVMNPAWKMDHIGVVVKNLDEAMAYYQVMGFAAFTPNPSTVATDRKVYGKPANDVKNRGAESPLGPIRFEMLQPIAGESIQKHFLMKKGEGVNHIGFIVDDLDTEVAKLEAMGFPVISSGKIPPDGGFAYVDTTRVGGLIIELIKPQTM